MRFRALIVDDEAPARSELRHLLGEHPQVEIVGEAATAKDALTLAATVSFDAVFLDIEMPGLSGLDAARLIRASSQRPDLVFVTAHDRYAVDAFAVEATDYLLKPVDPQRLARVVDRLGKRTRPDPPAPGKLAVVSAGKTALVDFDAVHYVHADGDYSRIHTYDRSYLCTSSLREVEQTLPRTRFLRIHRSYLVNLAKVASVSRAGPDRLRLTLDDAARTELDVARRQGKQVRERLRL
jgi:two-component system, LytTR family, response regulator LytT